MRMTVEDREYIRDAVAAAEATTRAEVVCVLTDEASDYLEVPLAFTAIAALLLPLAWMFSPFPWMAGQGDWATGNGGRGSVPAMEAVGVYALVQLIVLAAVLGITSIPVVRRALTPGALRRACVHQRAVEQFRALGLHRTRERTGVLIFASLEDRTAEIIADTGINEKVQPGAWSGVIGILVQEIRKGHPAQGFIATVKACGDLIDGAFPPAPVNPNELSDDLVEVRRS